MTTDKTSHTNKIMNPEIRYYLACNNHFFLQTIVITNVIKNVTVIKIAQYL